MFEMPKQHDCKCREGLNYNPENETCIKCVKAGNALKGVLEAILKSGDVDMIFMFAQLLIERQIQERNKEKEKENKGDN